MVFVCDVSNSPLCIGGYSVLPVANLLAFGITQARFSFTLAEPQLCLWSSNVAVSIGVGFMYNFHRPYDLCYIISLFQGFVGVSCLHSRKVRLGFSYSCHKKILNICMCKFCAWLLTLRGTNVWPGILFVPEKINRFAII